MLCLCGAEDGKPGLQTRRQALYRLSYIIQFYLFYGPPTPTDSPPPHDHQHPQDPHGHHPSLVINLQWVGPVRLREDRIGRRLFQGCPLGSSIGSHNIATVRPSVADDE